LFHDTVNSSDHIALNKSMIHNNKLKTIMKEAVVAYYEVYTGMCLERLKKHEKPLSV
jgi:hypothetical protein